MKCSYWCFFHRGHVGHQPRT